MNKKISLVIDFYLENKIFNLDDNKRNRDNCLASFHALKKAFDVKGYNISTCDINTEIESEFSIYFDLSNKVTLESKFNYLILMESELIKPLGWYKENQTEFDKIFTWNDDLVDNVKFFKINFSHLFPSNRTLLRDGVIPFENKKLCTLIAGSKKIVHELELYSERVRTIRWFEENEPDCFDLYGIGWDKYVTDNKYVQFLLSKFSILAKLFSPNYPSYKGAVDSKRKTMCNYKFAICYENAQMIPGYITEKIFDCFFSGCIPIYWGAPNITEHIPKNCFIDRRMFKTHEELYHYMKNMTKKEYVEIQTNIENYLYSKKAAPYQSETFANILVEHVITDHI
ncbi:glycosyltransferase family 10 [Vibrio aestuarianus]|uniref:glycosyltransferase family 10 domain-containing protein n=1 Tax=Vibrio aestuarianus TaxID=28171 RepID=UPI001C3D5B75|nr:glycosyltransferase family 10 [Vibrio aestuarianus]MDE1309876.1 glycosyltransferase family 10 [Vibrio aestuarianus]